MSLTELRKLIELKQIKDVEEIIIKIGFEKIIQLVSPILCEPDGITFVDGLLSSLQCTTRESLCVKVKIFECVFKFVQVESGSGGSRGAINMHALGALIGILLRHLDNLPTNVLMPFVEKYLEHVKIGEPLQGRWLDLLPKLVCTISERNDIYLGSRQLSGDDYRCHILRTLYDCDWPAETSTALLMFLKELNLDKEEVPDALQKVQRVLVTVPYDSVPPIVYQLVLLAQDKLPGATLKVVIDYFNQQESKLSEEIHRHECSSSATSEAMDDIGSADKDEEVAALSCRRNELHAAQGTVLLHLTHLAQLDPCVARDYVRLIRSATCMPHVVFSPFNLTLAMALSSIERYQEQMLDAVRSSVLHCLLQKRRSVHCAWLRKTWPTCTDLQSVLRSILNNSAVGWEQVSVGICRLLLPLLSGGTGVRKEAASLAVSTLPLVLTRHPHLVQHVITCVTDSLLTMADASHYIELLSRVCRCSPMLLLQHQSLLRSALVYQLPHLLPHTATQTLVALTPLVRLDPSLREALVLTLRKMLFSRCVQQRCVAVGGLLLLLRALRVSSALPSSQASLSFSSALSQMSCTTQVHNDVPTDRNEALCCELLGTLRRCFSQQHQVRSALYNGLPDICRANPRLAPHILSLLHQHLTAFIDLRPDTLNPVMVQKAVQVQGDTAVLLEPLGELLTCVSGCKRNYEARREDRAEETEDEDDDEDNVRTVLNDLNIMFDTLADKLSACNMDDLELDNRLDLSQSAVGQRNVLHAQVMIAVYDATMEYVFYDISSNCIDKMQRSVSLFKIRKKIVDFIKNKTVKISAKRTEVSKGKDRSASRPNVSSHSILKIGLIAKMLATAFGEEDVPDECSGILKDCYDLQIYLLTSTDTLVMSHKSVAPQEREYRLPHLRHIARVLFVQSCEHCGRTVEGDDKEVARLRHCISIFNALIVCFDQYHRDKMEQILKEITKKTASRDINSLSFLVFKGCQKMLLRILNHNDNEPLMKDAATLIQIIAQMTKFMSYDSEEVGRAYEWLIEVAKEHTVSHSQFCEELLHLLFSLSNQLKVSHSYYHLIARDVYHCLGDNDQGVSVSDAAIVHSIVNEDTVSTSVAVLMTHVENTLTHVEMSLNKQRAHLVTGTTHDSNAVEGNINGNLGMIIKTINVILRSALPLGAVMDTVIKRADKLYTILALFVRYYLDLYRLHNLPQISEKFEKLIDMSGELLSDPLYLFLNYVEDARSNGKGVALNTALRESKMIPSLVFAIEKYEKLVIQLSKKSKVNLMTSMKLSTLRDFKIETTKLVCNLVGESSGQNVEPESNRAEVKRKKVACKESKSSHANKKSKPE